MRIVCAPESALARAGDHDLDIVLYGPARNSGQASVGALIPGALRRQKLEPSARAWDLLSIALAVVATDVSVSRADSPDGWTRILDLQVAVSDPDFWTSQADVLVHQLRFLTTDVWSVTFCDGDPVPVTAKQSTSHQQDSVVLLSGGLDSLIGAIDIVRADGRNPYAVSHITRGDRAKQQMFASAIGGGLAHLQLNHNASYPGGGGNSQRARSVGFLAYGVLAATALAPYRDGGEVTLYVCENGFISLNPPLTGSRLGSLSTRTTHPFFLGLFQQLLTAADIRVRLENPYQFRTKGEMLQGCSDQALLQQHASLSTSCGRYLRHGYKHCGRCLPCLIRRAAFHASDIRDDTQYVYADLAQDDDAHARYDDVRSAAMAAATVETEGVSSWAGPALSTTLLGNAAPYADVVSRGISELGSLLSAAGVA